MAETPPLQPRIMPECVDSFLTTAGMLRCRMPAQTEPGGVYTGEQYVCGEIEGDTLRVCGLQGGLDTADASKIIATGSCLMRVLHDGMPLMEE